MSRRRQLPCAPYDSGAFLRKSEMLGIERRHLLSIVRTVVEMLNDNLLEPTEPQLARDRYKKSEEAWFRSTDEWLSHVVTLDPDDSPFEHRLDIVGRASPALLERRKKLLAESLPFLDPDPDVHPCTTAILFVTNLEKGIVHEAEKWAQQELKAESVVLVTPNSWPKAFTLEMRNAPSMRVMQQQYLLTNITKSRHFMPYLRLTDRESEKVLSHYHCLPDQIRWLLPNEADVQYYDLRPGDHVVIFHLKSPTGFTYGLRRVVSWAEMNKKIKPVLGKKKKKDSLEK